MVAGYLGKAMRSTDPITDLSKSSPDQNEPDRRRGWPSGTRRRPEQLVRRPVLGPNRARPTQLPQRRLLGGGAVATRCLQGARLRSVAEQLQGGPVFPAMFLGAAGGTVMSHLPGLPLVPAVAMGIGAMCVVMLGLPLTSVLLATLLVLLDALRSCRL